jgi:hypothetical protein
MAAGASSVLAIDLASRKPGERRPCRFHGSAALSNFGRQMRATAGSVVTAWPILRGDLCRRRQHDVVLSDVQ